MANMIKDLLSPDQAKLLDDQLRKQSLQQGVTNYGSDPMGRFLTAASGAQRASEGFGMAAERVFAGRQMGANETRSVQAQQAAQAKQAQIQQALQNKTPEQLTAIYRNAITAGKNDLAASAKALMDSYETGGDGVKYKNVKNVMTADGTVVPAKFNNSTGRYENLNTGQVLDVSSVEVDDGEGGVPQ